MENFTLAVPDVDTAYENVQKYTKNKGLENFRIFFNRVYSEVK